MSKAGLYGQVTVAEESTYGTYVSAGARPYEPKAEVSFGLVKNVVQGGGVAAGRLVQPGAARVVVGKSGSGTLVVEARSAKLGLLLKHVFGSTPTPTVQNTSTGYLQAHTLADAYGKSLTIQSGVPELTAGTVRPYSFLGCKVTSMEVSCTMNDIAQISVEFDFRDVTEAQSLVAASYPTTGLRPFNWKDLTVKLGTYGSEASVQGVRGFSYRIERPQDAERFYAGNSGLKSEPIQNEYSVVSGSIEADYYDKTTFADRFAADTSTSLRFTFEDTSTSLGGAPLIYPKFELFASMAFLNEGTPKLNGPGVVSTPYAFVGQNDLTNPVAGCNYISTDTSL